MSDVDKIPFSKEELHNYLDQLLRTNREGDKYAEMFWEFVGALAWGRGIVERLDAMGNEAADKVAESPPKSLPDRKQRAYHVGVMSRLLMDAAGQRRTEAGYPISPPILPGNFNAGLIVRDLLVIAEQSPSGSKGDPNLLLRNMPTELTDDGNKRADGDIRAFAKWQIVLGIRYRMGQTGQTLDALRNEFKPELEKSTEEGWRRVKQPWRSPEQRAEELEQALQKGRAAREGKQQPRPPYADWGEITGKLYEIARGSQGVEKGMQTGEE